MRTFSITFRDLLSLLAFAGLACESQSRDVVPPNNATDSQIIQESPETMTHRIEPTIGNQTSQPP